MYSLLSPSTVREFDLRTEAYIGRRGKGGGSPIGCWSHRIMFDLGGGEWGGGGHYYFRDNFGLKWQ